MHTTIDMFTKLCCQMPTLLACPRSTVALVVLLDLAYVHINAEASGLHAYIALTLLVCSRRPVALVVFLDSAFGYVKAKG